MSENMTTTTETRMPMIGDPAPAFRAMTTKGKINFPEDYRGSWVVLFSHPADFTPVCTTEFIEFTRMTEAFAALNTRLLGLSIDSLHSHLAWAKSIESIDWDGKGKVRITFPIIADISMNVARKYGMLQTVAKTQTVRAVFIIDPEGFIRTILYYPMSTGRNLPEIKRIVQALQKHDEANVSTPANWQPGDNVIIGAPKTLEEAEERLASQDEDLIKYEWYLTMKKDK
jgi:peroxiredoxin (alkyl hydroperoxide reductase subunit C)